MLDLKIDLKTKCTGSMPIQMVLSFEISFSMHFIVQIILCIITVQLVFIINFICLNADINMQKSHALHYQKLFLLAVSSSYKLIIA